MNTFDIVVTIFCAVSMMGLGLCFALALLKINKERNSED